MLFYAFFSLLFVVLDFFLHIFKVPRSKKGLTGRDYEYIAADYLRKHGYYDVHVTQRSGDYGVDIVARKGRDKWAVQCKYYSSPVGIGAVHEVVGGKAHYGCNRAMVITNNVFTKPARELAYENNVRLLECVLPRQQKGRASTNSCAEAIVITALILTGCTVLALLISGKIKIPLLDTIPDEVLWTCTVIIVLVTIISFICVCVSRHIRKKRGTQADNSTVVTVENAQPITNASMQHEAAVQQTEQHASEQSLDTDEQQLTNVADTDILKIEEAEHKPFVLPSTIPDVWTDPFW